MKRRSFSQVLTQKWTLRIISVSLFLAVWEIVGRKYPLHMSFPTAIGIAAYELITTGKLIEELLMSLRELTAGFSISLVVGISLGLLMGASRKLEYTIDPYVNILYSIPYVTLIPVIMIWFGLGFYARVLIVFVSSFIPVCINTFSGVRNISLQLVETARSYGANDTQIFTKVAIPASLPFIMTGVRLGIGRAVVGMIISEMFTAIVGLGWMLMYYGNTFATDKVFVVILTLGFLGMTLTELVKYLERRITPWKEAAF